MGNNIVTAIANGSAPYLANEVKNQIQGNSVESDIQRTIAHGLLNAGLALAKGENAVVQASGAMTGETVGILSHSLYGKTPEELTETEKQNISAWATLTSGIVGGLISDNSTGVANAAQAGKVVVENNWLSTNQLENFAHKARTCVGEECQQVIRDMVDANIRQQEEIKQICSTSPEQCKQQYGYLVEQWNAFDTAIKHLAADKSLPDDFRDYLPAVYMLSMDATGLTVEHQWAKRFEAMGLEPETAGLIAMALPGMINGGSGKGNRGTTDKRINNSKLESEKNALNRIGENSNNTKNFGQKEANSVYNKQLIINAEKISTAKPGQQTAVPRDLNEQTFWKEVQANPILGSKLLNMNKDPRFPTSAGFQKMEAKHKLPDGQTITIHYQFNSTTGKAYDMKITSPQRMQQDPKQVVDTIKDNVK
ncbi:VENN motif pre-toxin domain-containing protein [Proteus terrae]|nr:VENN motif pre-toxin domain-containing protein [Proteus terrae]WCG91706.1 VENN motif pre-toxin domain-containing protein [Proteus terrae]